MIRSLANLHNYILVYDIDGTIKLCDSVFKHPYLILLNVNVLSAPSWDPK